MVYLHYYESASTFNEEYYGDAYKEPWASYVTENKSVKYNKSEHEKLLETPLTTIAKENGTISFNIWKSMGTDMITSVSYSTDSGETWTTTNNTNNKSENLAITVNVNGGDRVMWKANAQQTGYEDENDYVGSFFSSTCEFDVEGNVMSMINDATGLTYDGQLCCLFFNYDDETECLVVDASKLLLPATTLANCCYLSMFYDCTSLTTTPELPSNTLARSCYERMFAFCGSLTTAPALPATTLAEHCYNNMFGDCTGLTQAPELPATTLANYCYTNMFYDCTSLATAPELPATTLTDSCYFRMFYDCTGLTQAPELPATTLASSCYNNMFRGCRSLTTAPELPATTLTGNCYRYMFNNCTSLNYIKCLATDISATNCTYKWVNGVASSGTFVTPSTTAWSTGDNGIPRGWTVVDAS